MTELYSLRFRPLFRRYLWGGRRLDTVLGKPIGDGSDYAESWELVDRGADQSVVMNGPLAGTTLRELVSAHGEQLFGRHHPQSRFPLLIKFLDANVQLSVQVHPNDAQAAALSPPDLGKTEAWVILAAEPGSYIYAGLKPGVDRRALQQAIESGTCEECLHRLEPRAGDCIFLPAGTVHALGPGLLVAEIQQSSDTTYRLYDWNRKGSDGKPRELHIEKGIAVIDFASAPVAPQRPDFVDGVEQLVSCDKFVLERRQVGNAEQSLGGDSRFHVLMVLDGTVRFADGPGGSLRHGETLLLPAAAPAVNLSSAAGAVVLDAYLP